MRAKGMHYTPAHGSVFHPKALVIVILSVVTSVLVHEIGHFLPAFIFGAGPSIIFIPEWFSFVVVYTIQVPPIQTIIISGAGGLFSAIVFTPFARRMPLLWIVVFVQSGFSITESIVRAIILLTPALTSSFYFLNLVIGFFLTVPVLITFVAWKWNALYNQYQEYRRRMTAKQPRPISSIPKRSRFTSTLTDVEERGCTHYMCKHRHLFRSKYGRYPDPDKEECSSAICPLIRKPSRLRV
jgi:hypothetical protein